MTTSHLGRAVACLEAFAGGLCLTLVAAAFLHAADIQISAVVGAPADIPTATATTDV